MRAYQVIIPELKVPDILVGFASVDMLLACFHILDPSLHCFSCISLLLLQVDCEVTAAEANIAIKSIHSKSE